MPRPTTKATLLAAGADELARLEALLAPLSAAQQCAPGVVGDWSVEDVLAHLTAWHEMVLAWHAAGLRGEVPETPGGGFSWQQTPALNQQIYLAHHDEPLDEVWAAFRASAARVRAAIEAASEEQLFARNVYTWTKSTTLGAYFVSATSSHYAWARTEIRKGIKAKAG